MNVFTQAYNTALVKREDLPKRYEDLLHPMQAAFIECDAFQCGYCTPGQIMSAVCLLEEAARGVPSHATPDVAAPPSLDGLGDEEIRERMSGNICRCGARRRQRPGGRVLCGRHDADRSDED